MTFSGEIKHRNLSFTVFDADTNVVDNVVANVVDNVVDRSSEYVLSFQNDGVMSDSTWAAYSVGGSRHQVMLCLPSCCCCCC